MKKRPERRKHCALAVVRRSEKFSPTADPFPGARDGQNLISWRWSLSLSTNPVWWMHAISIYRNTQTHPQPTNPQTHRLHYTAPLSLARSVMKWTPLSNVTNCPQRAPSFLNSTVVWNVSDSPDSPSLHLLCKLCFDWTCDWQRCDRR